MDIKKYLKSALVVAISAITLNSCVNKDEWDTPAINCNNRFDAPTISMADFVAKTPATGTYFVPNGASDPAVIFDAYVVSSDENGNFYKTISFQDKPENPTVGLQMEVDKASNFADFPVGAHIRIKANGLRLGLDRGTKKIGSVDPTYAIGRIPSSLITRYLSGVCNGNQMDIAPIKPVQLANLSLAMQDKYINMLVSVPNVQFNISEIYPIQKSYIDYVGGAGADTDRKIEDAFGGSTVLRSSGFSTFGSTLLPKGAGELTFVVSKYNTNFQMIIRSLADVKIPATGTRFDPTPPKGGSAVTFSETLLENFESYTATNQEDFPKYINDPVLGNRYWQLKTFSGNKYIQLSANGGTGLFETFFIVPVKFVPGKILSFNVNVGYYNGNALKVYTSTNYTPLGDVTSATLTDITSNFTIPTTPTNGYGTLAPAGTYQFPANLSGNGFVMFKYVGNGSGVTTTLQLDNIAVQ